MLQVSDSALALLKEALVLERKEDNHVFRLELQDDKFVLGLDDVHSDDVKYEHDGEAVLAAPSEIATSVLDSTTIDIETTDQGPRLVLVS